MGDEMAAAAREVLLGISRDLGAAARLALAQALSKEPR
jgi:hypothetical protein